MLVALWRLTSEKEVPGKLVLGCKVATIFPRQL